tara:strand:+ start:152 stop:361 length:210 start_codon:yes stop_codon:yes gene_type:complete
MSYSFGVPSLVIWLSHITFGLYFIYLGYKMINYPKLKIDGLTILVVGALMTAYHAHLWYYNKNHKSKNE